MPVMRKYIDKTKKYNEVYGDYINGIKVIRLFGLQNKKEEIIRSKADELKLLNMEQAVIRKKMILFRDLL